MSEPHILVAGIGNIFLGDDAFGVEVARCLQQRRLPSHVQVVDFGIRSYDLAFALLKHPAATILVDAARLGEEPLGPPGSLHLIELSMDDVPARPPPAGAGNGAPALPATVDAHSMNPVAALQLVKQYGGNPQRLYLIGCEPQTLVSERGHFGLSKALQHAVPAAIEMIEELLDELLAELKKSDFSEKSDF